MSNMDWKLEVVVVPVTDVDRAKDFYVGKLGFHLDTDTQPTPALRVVHMTPPGSACSVVIGPTQVPAGTNLGSAGSYQLVVTDIAAASSSSSPTPTATTGPCRRSATTSAPSRPSRLASRDHGLAVAIATPVP
jgi:Glyoxalase/Bleomycin resistance protein/Dioxygenase superfamily